MRVHAPVIGLLWRPGVLWDVFVLVFASLFLPHLVGRVPLVISGEIAAAKSFEVSVVTAQFCWAFLSGWALGSIASFAWQDLTHCPLSWLLPGLRHKIRRDLFALATLLAVVVAIASVVQLAELGILASAGLAYAGYGIGNHLWDPHSSRVASHLAWTSSLVFVGFAEPIVAFLREWPSLALVGPLLCAISIWQTTRVTTVRRRTLVPVHELGASFEDYGQGTTVGPTPRPAARPQARWCWGRVHALQQWVNAVRYEEHGYAGAELFLKHGLVLGATQLFCFVGEIAELALPLGALLIVLFQRQDLRRGVIYPISRNSRARVVWAVAREQGLYFLGWSLAVHSVLLFAESRVHGTAMDWRGMAVFSATALLVAAGLPFLQLVRLHLLEFHQGPVTMLRFGTTLLFSSVAFCAGAIWLDHELRELNLGVHFLLALALLSLSLFLLRRHLAEWYQRADLV